MPRLDPAAEARRLRDHREAFELALSANITVVEARRQIVEARWKQRDAMRARCGTQAPVQVLGRRADPVPEFPVPDSPLNDSDEGLMWWQK